MEDYLVPAQAAVTEFTEKRSRFIGHIFCVETQPEALACLQQLREKHWDAKHHVYAYVLHSGEVRCSDDGEPQGTGGLPVLEVLRRNSLQNVCCVVTRYFGGILLGASGLTRAYARSAAAAVEAAGLASMQSWTRLALTCPYPLYDRLCRETAAFDGFMEPPVFGAGIELQLLLPQAKAEAFQRRLTELSSGTVAANVLGEEYRITKINKKEDL